MKNVHYLKRNVDDVLKFKLQTFGAVNIVGPKWCGKSTTAAQFSNSAIKFQDISDKETLKVSAKINPGLLLNGEKPRLIDEWQEAPELWDAVRASVDNSSNKGLYILTGSTSKKPNTAHTGTGRISTLEMYTMSLYESQESNGTVSIKDLFSSKELYSNGCESKLNFSDLIFATCRGGWPESVKIDNKKKQLAIADDYFKQIYKNDIHSVDNTRRNSETCKRLLQSYARNISTLAKNSTIIADINSSSEISKPTFYEYHDMLNRLFIIEDLPAWSPAIRSKSAIRKGPKREFTDPSIAVAALGVTPDYFNTDLLTFGFIFETLCIRDLRIYSQNLGGHLSYYHDKTGLEADAVLHLKDGTYAIMEFKLGQLGIDEGAKNLNKIEELCKKSNNVKPPDLKIVITATQYGYKRPDNVFVIPIGCLKD